jgi:hypothetical protein
VTYIPQVEAKLSRAIELLDGLDVLCKTYLNLPNFYIDKQLVERNKWDLVLRMHENPPLKLGILVGDIVHNMRSSLDIGLFHYLREANPDGFSGLSNWALRGINFPIFDSEVDFSSDKWHGGLAEAQLLFDLREVQPFRNLELFESVAEHRNIVETSPLWQLHTLWNTDKHRGINLVVGGLDLLALGLDAGQQSVWTQKDAPPWRDGSKLYTVEIKSGAEVPTLNLSETFAIGLESDVRPLQIYPIVSKLQALLGITQHCHWILQRWFENRK